MLMLTMFLYLKFILQTEQRHYTKRNVT